MPIMMGGMVEAKLCHVTPVVESLKNTWVFFGSGVKGQGLGFRAPPRQRRAEFDPRCWVAMISLNDMGGVGLTCSKREERDAPTSKISGNFGKTMRLKEKNK